MSVFDPKGKAVSSPLAASNQPVLSSVPKALPSPTALTTRRSQPLRASLARPWSRTPPVSSPVSAAKPTTSFGRRGPGAETPAAEFRPAEGAKCARCWRVLPEVGQPGRRHADLCLRCEAAVA